jgi:hypothetical protein
VNGKRIHADPSFYPARREDQHRKQYGGLVDTLRNDGVNTVINLYLLQELEIQGPLMIVACGQDTTIAGKWTLWEGMSEFIRGNLMVVP